MDQIKTGRFIADERKKHGYTQRQLAIGVFAVGLYVATQGERTIGYYKCPKCDEYFIPTYKAYMKGMHFLSTRKLQCPHCGQKVWAKKVMSQDE